MIEIYDRAWADYRFKLDVLGAINVGDWFKLAVSYDAATKSSNAWLNGVQVPSSNDAATSNYCVGVTSPPCTYNNAGYEPDPNAALRIGKSTGFTTLKGAVRNFKWYTYSATLPGGGSALVQGDPHMTNVLGEQFDLRHHGTHELLHIPRGASPADTLLLVKAVVRKGVVCSHTYVKNMSMTGKWPEAKKVGGIHFEADPGPNSTNKNKVAMTFGPIYMHVVRKTTRSGFHFLNFAALHLREVGQPIGGLLGEDDHTWASTLECPPGVSLNEYTEDSGENDPLSEFRADFD